MDTQEEIAGLLAGEGPVRAARVAEWLRSADGETLAGAMRLVREHAARLDAPLPPELLRDAAVRYYSRAFRVNRAGRFTEDRVAAGRSLAAWFFALLEQDPVPGELLAALRGMLAELYRTGDAALRDSLVNDCLDHLFESRRVAVAFADWAEDSALEPAWRAATDWGEGFWSGHRSGAGGS